MSSGPTALEVCRDLNSLNISSRLKETSEMVLDGMGFPLDLVITWYTVSKNRIKIFVKTIELYQHLT